LRYKKSLFYHRDITKLCTLKNFTSPQLTESQLISTESSLNERQPNSKRKKQYPPDSEEVVSTTEKNYYSGHGNGRPGSFQPNPNKNISKAFNTRN